MIRINKGFEVFEVPKIMIQVKNAYSRKLQRIIDGDRKLANNIYLDNNKIEEILLISYSLRILKLVIIIGNVCYLLAIFWIIGCQTFQDFGRDIDDWREESEHSDKETFIYYFSLHTKSLE